ncbi:MAG TPA: Fpg/Nei family DNA glycosylase [Actinomycetales bacterium]|uniref:Fpg/Nei family DNA glycosylase n=1 Tax=uncultured Corynebacterium sp. TaxID=159447 RepID=UPI00175DF1F1|nr:DNA-formamidopyrimidine glycosylase family protein [uncultured Corynebacterium sp.]HHU46081.1 Fpg/Nei family DNA glycosylase [Actinomycetales bacterium]
MPEGHVIHRLARELNDTFAGRPLSVTSPQGRFAAEAALLDGAAIDHAEAWGKHLFVEFDVDRPDNIIHIHLGLIGHLRFEGPDDMAGQVRLHITDGRTSANLRGPQWCRLITDAERSAAIAKVGEDPLRADASPGGLVARVRRSRRPIGALLVDQGLYAGVGSIYRTETLFRLGIHPLTTGAELDAGTIDAIWDDLRELMRDGVRVGRIDTVRPEHTPEAMGREPRADDHGGEVYVYRRTGQPCHVCGTPVAETPIEARRVFYCPTCQPV